MVGLQGIAACVCYSDLSVRAFQAGDTDCQPSARSHCAGTGGVYFVFPLHGVLETKLNELLKIVRFYIKCKFQLKKKHESVGLAMPFPFLQGRQYLG